jgi:hypothetical protein
MDFSNHSSPVGQQQLQLPLVGFVDDLAESQASLPLPGLFGQDVTRMRFSEHKFSGASFLEAFGRRAIGFDLRHFRILSTCSFMKKGR